MTGREELASIVPVRDDPALARVNGRLLRKFGAETDRALQRYTTARTAMSRRESREARRQAKTVEETRVRLTFEQVKGAWLVRDRYGWHRVVRVSAKSVTVATPYSWTDRIPLDRILEARFEGAVRSSSSTEGETL